MKINNVQIEGPRIIKKYLMVNDEVSVELRFRALKTEDSFDKIVEPPKPPAITKPGGVVQYLTEDPTYKIVLAEYNKKVTAYNILKCMDNTQGLEWDTVKMDDPDTFVNWESEVEEHFGRAGVNVVMAGYIEANSLSEDLMEEARKRFLLTVQADQSQ